MTEVISNVEYSILRALGTDADFRYDTVDKNKGIFRLEGWLPDEICEIRRRIKLYHFLYA